MATNKAVSALVDDLRMKVNAWEQRVISARVMGDTAQEQGNATKAAEHRAEEKSFRFAATEIEELIAKHSK